MTIWLVLITIGACTYALRISMFVILADRSLPAWTDTPLALVAPAATAALIVSMTLSEGGQFQLAPLPELIAITGGFVATRRSGNVMHAITVGLPLFWAASLIFG